MKFLLPLATALASLGLAHPAVEARDDVQTVRLVFHAGPASYEMTFPADGVTRPTDSDLAVDIIDAPDYLPSLCTFTTAGEKTLVYSLSHGDDPFNQVVVGPPQAITGVSCEGICITTYGNCYDNNNQYIGPCCNGYCAATKCRPWGPLP